MLIRWRRFRRSACQRLRLGPPGPLFLGGARLPAVLHTHLLDGLLLGLHVLDVLNVGLDLLRGSHRQDMGSQLCASRHTAQAGKALTYRTNSQRGVAILRDRRDRDLHLLELRRGKRDSLSGQTPPTCTLAVVQLLAELRVNDSPPPSDPSCTCRSPPAPWCTCQRPATHVSAKAVALLRPTLNATQYPPRPSCLVFLSCHPLLKASCASDLTWWTQRCRRTSS